MQMYFVFYFQRSLYICLLVMLCNTLLKLNCSVCIVVKSEDKIFFFRLLTESDLLLLLLWYFIYGLGLHCAVYKNLRNRASPSKIPVLL